MFLPQREIAPLLVIDVPHPQLPCRLLVPGIAHVTCSRQALNIIGNAEDRPDRRKFPKCHREFQTFLKCCSPRPTACLQENVGNRLGIAHALVGFTLKIRPGRCGGTGAPGSAAKAMLQQRTAKQDRRKIQSALFRPFYRASRDWVEYQPLALLQRAGLARLFVSSQPA